MSSSTWPWIYLYHIDRSQSVLRQLYIKFRCSDLHNWSDFFQMPHSVQHGHNQKRCKCVYSASSKGCQSGRHQSKVIRAVRFSLKVYTYVHTWERIPVFIISVSDGQLHARQYLYWNKFGEQKSWAWWDMCKGFVRQNKNKNFLTIKLSSIK